MAPTPIMMTTEVVRRGMMRGSWFREAGAGSASSHEVTLGEARRVDVPEEATRRGDRDCPSAALSRLGQPQVQSAAPLLRGPEQRGRCMGWPDV